jgi:hypothetical protein
MSTIRKAAHASFSVGDVLNGDPSYESILDSPSRDIALIKKTRKRIDKELAILNILKAHRNALAPISRLPPELLSQIFMYVARREDWPLDDGQPSFYRGCMSWMKVAGICRHWRAVALHFPMLWTDLCFSDYHLTRKMLRRSQNLPVTVVCDLSDHFKTRKTQSVYLTLGHSSRIQTLHIRGPCTRLRRIFSKMTSASPYLESLCVSVSGRNGDELTLPTHLFCGNMPQLRRIQLTRCSLEWDSPDFSRLTHLEVRGSSASPLVDMEVVLAVLRKIPSLVTLYLTKCVMPSSSMVSNPEPIVMNHLSHLRLDTASFRLLWQIRYRVLASLALSTPSIQSSTELSSLLRTITSHFSAMSGEDQLQTLLVEAGHSFISMRGWTMVHWYKVHQVIIEPIQLDLQLLWDDGTQEKGFEIMTRLLKRLPIGKLEQLELHLGSLSPVSFDRWTRKMWVELLRGSAIQAVRLHQPGQSIFTFITALIPHYDRALANGLSSDHQPLSKPEVFLPQLVQICIITTDFSELLTGGSSFLHLLSFALIQMKICMEGPMESLELMISNCSNISEADVTGLKEFIAVEWDGEDTAREDDDEPAVIEFFDDFRYSEEEDEDF